MAKIPPIKIDFEPAVCPNCGWTLRDDDDGELTSAQGDALLLALWCYDHDVDLFEGDTTSALGEQVFSRTPQRAEIRRDVRKNLTDRGLLTIGQTRMNRVEITAAGISFALFMQDRER